jgi:hypothetical protein
MSNYYEADVSDTELHVTVPVSVIIVLVFLFGCLYLFYKLISYVKSGSVSVHKRRQIEGKHDLYKPYYFPLNQNMLLLLKFAIVHISFFTSALASISFLKTTTTSTPIVTDTWEIERSQLLIYERECIGKGAFSVVYQGIWNTINWRRSPKHIVYAGKLVTMQYTRGKVNIQGIKAAVKLIPQHWYNDTFTTDNFMKEINTMKVINNKRIAIIIITATIFFPESQRTRSPT